MSSADVFSTARRRAPARVLDDLLSEGPPSFSTSPIRCPSRRLAPPNGTIERINPQASLSDETSDVGTDLVVITR